MSHQGRVCRQYLEYYAKRRETDGLRLIDHLPQRPEPGRLP